MTEALKSAHEPALYLVFAKLHHSIKVFQVTLDLRAIDHNVLEYSTKKNVSPAHKNNLAKRKIVHYLQP